MRLRRKNSVILLSEYFSVLEGKSNEFIEKKSRFIGFCSPIKDEKEALEILEDKRREFKDATHNCWAYILKEDMSMQRYSDDKEPSGTAGIPILEVMKKEGITNALCLVTRYFGGTLLGAGGLVRAYTKGASLGIEAAKKVLMKDFIKMSFIYDYTFHGSILNYLMKEGYIILKENYMEKIELIIDVAEEDSKIIKDLNNLTSGKITIEEREKIILPTFDGKIIYK